ncbi:hypothetical protein [Helicobacter cholecystus]|uniref:hypothetical protein n=1 Tax=Helicobacter cholecystus TaxID=45498 RepID=UPI002739C28B|nr:hypothetical protein [Helicobacter cholecystus]
MNYKLPALIAFFLLLGGATIWLSITFKQSNSNNPTTLVLTSNQAMQTKKLTQEEWFYSMAKNNQESYAYPTNEMILKYNFKHGVEPLRVFIDDLSEYRFYCINQILIKNNIEYAYYKTDRVIQLVIFLNDKESQKKVLSDFDYYKINYTFQK